MVRLTSLSLAQSSFRGRTSRIRAFLKKQLKFIGPGIVASVAYCDPGNWATDLEAGSTFGYAHLFVILSASLMAILLQILSVRLGYLTGKDLAQHCRLRFHNRPDHKLLWRWCCLYPLYFICEAGIIFTDLAELLGSAIALHMLIPALPLYAGVLLTSLDVFLVLLFFNSYPAVSEHNRRSMYIFEICIAGLVLAVSISFIILLVKVSPDWGQTFKGFLPSDRMIKNGALYLAVSILGATVMPHSIFLGSKVAIMDRLVKQTCEDDSSPKASPHDRTVDDDLTNLQQHTLLPSLQMPQPTRLRARPRTREPADSLEHVKAHLTHASLDVAVSLITLAMPINAAILIIGSAAFYYGNDNSPIIVADLADAYKLLSSRVGQGAGYVFAIALLISGQAASITVTLAGQIVSEGFLEWRTRPFVRRLVTRLIGIVPSALVAALVGPRGLDNLLVGSQVALSLVLPFVVAPLIIFTSDPEVMCTPVYSKVTLNSPAESSPPRNLPVKAPDQSRPQAKGQRRVSSEGIDVDLATEGPSTDLIDEESSYQLHNNWIIKSLTWAIFLLVSMANVYAIVQLAQGKQ